MLFIIVIISLICFSLVFLVTVINAVTAPFILKGPQAENRKFVSVLIPARNEEKNIRRCLDSLLRQDYLHHEIVVLDDHSEDATPEILRSYAEKYKQIRLVNGDPLPYSWTGKNWACHQLSQQAKGNILIFSDADNFYSQEAITRTVGWMEKLNLGLISAFPQQITKTWSEKLIVPVFDLFVYSFLPLWLTYYSKFPSLAAANGQWLAFTRTTYKKLGGHAAVRDQVVEDVVLSRLAKKKGEKILTTSGKDVVFGRMYHSFKEVWLGFSKNAFGLMSYQSFPFFGTLTTMMVIFVLPYLLIFTSFQSWALLGVAANIILRLVLSIKYRHPIVTSVFFHPLGVLLTVLIGLNSFVSFHRGSIVWKGREVKFSR